jgi:hypothetical protein
MLAYLARLLIPFIREAEKEWKQKYDSRLLDKYLQKDALIDVFWEDGTADSETIESVTRCENGISFIVHAGDYVFFIKSGHWELTEREGDLIITPWSYSPAIMGDDQVKQYIAFIVS